MKAYCDLGPLSFRSKTISIYDIRIQSNLNSWNTDGLLTMANLNSFLSPYEILPISQEEQNIIKEIFLFYNEIVCCILIRIASLRQF